MFVRLNVRSALHPYLEVIPEEHAQSVITDSQCLESSGRSTYKGLLRAAAADANGTRLLQQVEVFFLELETFHTAFQAYDSRQLRPVVTHTLSPPYSHILSCYRQGIYV